MSEVMVKVLSGVIRVLLVPVTNWLVANGILTSNETVQFTAEVASWAVALGWTIWAWWHAHKRQMTALALPAGSTPNELKMTMKQGASAKAATGPDQSPTLKRIP